MATDTALDPIENHWAVRVVDPDERAVVMRYAMAVGARVANGDATRVPAMPALLIPLASAYVVAGREWLDFEASGSPHASLNPRQAAVRQTHVESAAGRAYLLTSALPVATRAEDHVAVLHRTLLLAALARVGRRIPDFDQWLLLFGRAVFPAATAANAPWERTMLQRVVEIWVHVLRGNSPSGLRPAMELVAQIREERGAREAERLAAIGADDRGRVRIQLASLGHLLDAATDLLIFRLHAEPERVTDQIYARLMRGREGAAGDPRLDASFDWLYEASRLVVEARTAQLELLPGGRA